MSVKAFAALEGWRRAVANGSELVPEGLQPSPPGASTEQLLRALVASSLRLEVLQAGTLEALNAQVQEGLVWGTTLVVNTAGAAEVSLPRLFSIGLTNDGPGNLLYRIPNRGAAVWLTLVQNEVIEYTFTEGLLETMAVRLPVAGAATPTLRLVGTY